MEVQIKITTYLLIGYVIARPTVMNGQQNDVQMSFYHMIGSNKKNVKMFTTKPHEGSSKMEFLRKKRFIVKVQVPVSKWSFVARIILL